jgi:hypothetical protein
MPLINLQTNLKSLKYGQDRFNEGSSGQPYITSDPDGGTNLSVGSANVLRLLGVNKIPLIPNVSTQLNRSKAGRFVNQVLGTDDFIRGGAIGAAQAAVNDTFRIGAFLTSLPRGPLFIAKQVGLQLSNPKLEVKKGGAAFAGGILKAIFTASPAQALSSVTGGLLSPTRIYNLGINTLAQVPANAFGIHFSRHGLLPIQDEETKYEKVVAYNNQGDSSNNRLVELKKKFSLGDFALEATGDYDQARKNVNDQNKGLRKDYRTQKKNYRQDVRDRKSLNKQLDSAEAGGGEGISRAPMPTKPAKPKYIKFKPADLTIDSYLTGPGSTYGIGNTILRRYTFTEDQLKNDEAKANSRLYAGRTRIDGSAIDYSEAIGKDSNNSIQNHSEIGAPLNSTLSKVVAQGINANYAELQSKIKTTLTQSGSYTGTYSTEDRKGNGTISTTDPQVLREASAFRYYGTGQPSDSGSRLTYNNSDVFSRTDSGIMSVVFRSVNPWIQPTPNPNDATLNQNEQRWIFSAYMSGYKDNFDATWNDVNYNGRAESFYIYNKFKRTVNFNLKIPCFNKVQLFEKHRALGQLASVTAGSYEGVLMGGVMIKVNLGNYLVGEYAILNNVSYSIPDDASWDIADDALLSMYIDASFSLTIVHKDLPRYQQADAKSGFFGYLPDRVKSTNGQGGFIAPGSIVSKFTKNEYTVPAPPPPPNPPNNSSQTSATNVLYGGEYLYDF